MRSRCFSKEPDIGRGPHPARLRAMKPPVRLNPIALALLLVVAPALAPMAQDVSGRSSIPRIACLGKVRVGWSTQADLAQRWGEGKEITGGHPNSGRLWRVKGTPWVL